MSVCTRSFRLLTFKLFHLYYLHYIVSLFLLVIVKERKKYIDLINGKKRKKYNVCKKGDRERGKRESKSLCDSVWESESGLVRVCERVGLCRAWNWFKPTTQLLPGPSSPPSLPSSFPPSLPSSSSSSHSLSPLPYHHRTEPSLLHQNLSFKLRRGGGIGEEGGRREGGGCAYMYSNTSVIFAMDKVWNAKKKKSIGHMVRCCGGHAAGVTRRTVLDKICEQGC